MAEDFGRYTVVDEVGRGPLAGPVVAAAVVLPPGLEVEGLGEVVELRLDDVVEDDVLGALALAYGRVVGQQEGADLPASGFNRLRFLRQCGQPGCGGMGGRVASWPG